MPDANIELIIGVGNAEINVVAAVAKTTCEIEFAKTNRARVLFWTPPP